MDPPTCTCVDCVPVEPCTPPATFTVSPNPTAVYTPCPSGQVTAPLADPEARGICCLPVDEAGASDASDELAEGSLVDVTLDAAALETESGSDSGGDAPVSVDASYDAPAADGAVDAGASDASGEGT